MNQKEEYLLYWSSLRETTKRLEFSLMFQNDMKELEYISKEIGENLQEKKRLEYYKDGIKIFKKALIKLNIDSIKKIESKKEVIDLLSELQVENFKLHKKIELEIMKKYYN